MHILQIGKYFLPVKGGIEKTTLDIADVLNDDNQKSDLLCFGSVGENYLYKSTAVFQFEPLISLWNFDFSFKYILKLIRLYRSCDIVHLHYPNILPTIIICVLQRFVKKPVVLHWHSDILVHKFAYSLFRPFEKMLLKISESVIYTSKNYLMMSNSLPLSLSKSVIMPSPISPIPEITGSKWLLSDHSRERFFVYFIGRHVSYKGLDVLLDAANLVRKDTVFIIAGIGPLTAKLKESCTNNQVIFTGRISDQEHFELLNDCHVFCLPSNTRAEAYGLVIGEALSAGTAVVCSDLEGSGMSWLNKIGETGLTFMNDSPEDLAEKIDYLNVNRSILNEYGVNARHRYKSELTLQKFGESLKNLYGTIK